MSDQHLDPEEQEMERTLRRIGPDRAPDRLPAPPLRLARGDAERGRSPWLRRAAWAASAIATFGAAFFLLRPGEEGAPVRHLPSGTAIRGAGEEIAAGPAEERIVSLPDGSRFRIDPRSRVRFAHPAGTDRVRVELMSGSLAADVVKGNRAVRIVSAAGEVVVVGTWFRVKAFRMHVPAEDRFDAIPVLAVEVDEGTVELAGSAGKVAVSAGDRGLVLGPAAPVLQEQASQRWEAVLDSLGAGWEAPGFAGGRVAGTLLAADWEGLAAQGGWKGVAADPSIVAAYRRPAAFLAALAAEPDDASGLLALYAVEKDPRVRAILKPHLERIAGQEAVLEAEEAGK